MSQKPCNTILIVDIALTFVKDEIYGHYGRIGEDSFLVVFNSNVTSSIRTKMRPKGGIKIFQISVCFFFLKFFSMVRGQVMFHILTAMEILSFLYRFHSKSTNKKKNA